MITGSGLKQPLPCTSGGHSSLSDHRVPDLSGRQFNFSRYQLGTVEIGQGPEIDSRVLLGKGERPAGVSAAVDVSNVRDGENLIQPFAAEYQPSAIGRPRRITLSTAAVDFHFPVLPGCRVNQVKITFFVKNGKIAIVRHGTDHHFSVRRY